MKKNITTNQALQSSKTITTNQTSNHTQPSTIYLAGGCFWGIQHLMQGIPGVTDTLCGYANGTGKADANYGQVCTGITGFREAVRVDYDPARVSLDKLLHIFLRVIDPEAVNRQGNDVGTQYQSGIYFVPGDTASKAAAVPETATWATSLSAPTKAQKASATASTAPPSALCRSKTWRKKGTGICWRNNELTEKTKSPTASGTWGITLITHFNVKRS